MTSADLSTPDKTAIRRRMRKARRNLSLSYRRQASRRLLHSLDQAGEFRYARRIAVYLTNDSEIDTSLFIRELQKRHKQLFLLVVDSIFQLRLVFVSSHRLLHGATIAGATFQKK